MEDRHHNVAILCLVLTLAQSTTKAWAGVMEGTQLLEDLFKTYDKDVIPALNTTAAVKLAFGISLRHLEINEDIKTADLNLWFRMYWKDHRLTWNPYHYGGIDSTRVPARHLWLPDIKIFNSLEHIANLDLSAKITNCNSVNSFEVVDHSAKVILYSDGTMFRRVPVKARVRCQSHTVPGSWRVEYECPLTVGSWTYSTRELDLQVLDSVESIDIADYDLRYADWEIQRHNLIKAVTYYPCCHDTYHVFKGSLWFRHK